MFNYLMQGMVKKSAGPRLKICQSCGEANPPRQFFCKQCSHPFYSEEYLASRASVSRPSTPTNEELGSVELAVPAAGVVESGFAGRMELFVERIVQSPIENQEAGLTRKLTIFSPAGEIEARNLRLHESVEVDNGVICNTGLADVTGISILGDVMAVTVGGCEVQFWSITGPARFVGRLNPTTSGDIVSAEWVKFSETEKISGLLLVATIDSVDVYCVPVLSYSAVDIDAESAMIWSTTSHIEGRIFPSACDGRISMNGEFVELLISNTLNNFVFFFRLEINSVVAVCDKRVFGYNDPGRRTADESSATGTCVSFSPIDSFKFFNGLSNGQILGFDIRNDFGPEVVVSTLAGIRRWLVAVKPSSVDRDFVLAAYQAGCFVNIPDGTVTAIGGEVGSAQCFGIGEIGTKIFAGLSTGVVLYCDRTVRDKLRRAMTAYAARWAVHTVLSDSRLDEDMSLEEKLIEKLTNKEIQDGEVFVKLFGKKEPPRSVRNLKARDGASNEPDEPLGTETQPLCVKCLVTRGDTVAYGVAGGFFHLFKYSDN